MMSTPHPTSTPLTGIISPTPWILGGVLGGGFFLTGMVILISVTIAVCVIIRNKRRNATNRKTVHKDATNHVVGK